ncbi:NtaA/DmoA family FMN-dependent monooxygenase [Paenibacillus sp. JCM 10914]|uniref:NtaA/DmoA family FMN-dependent monooxygenase n=1 Tax=Paenibacillus sp. JCM 10914 TaxID=1236974 RepID=UPI0003CC4927|nr:NtaA/DmoA family FMN-dependent monooxygenase [Paenibacillus sp. JCM 10914]GAE06243.1 nitrilotriacetate monooxygenase component A [Paenibacillus sp. JCM 10914]
MNNRQMQLVMQMGAGYGLDQGAWRMPGADPAALTDMDLYVEFARIAERGKIQMVFIADAPVLNADISFQPPTYPLEPLLALTAIARATERIGLVATVSTTFNHPYNVARQLKALDILSHGRAGWNAVTTSTALAALNFGEEVPDRRERYERAHEFIQLVEALWGSWGEDALVLDQTTGIFANMDKIKPIHLSGKYLSSRGPLPIPPSEQGQPVIFQAGGGNEGLDLAGKYASGVYANPYDIPGAKAYRQMVRSRAQRFGRNPDDIKILPGLIPSIASTEREALNRRKQLDQYLADLEGRVSYLGAMIGIPLSYRDIDQPIPGELLRHAHMTQDPRSERVLQLALKGLTVRDILAHGVINYHPVITGTPEQVADFMEEWFLAEACDGFAIQPDISFDGVAVFVDEVVPILQKRGLFHQEYEGATLREHMGVPYKYGR